MCLVIPQDDIAKKVVEKANNRYQVNDSNKRSKSIRIWSSVLQETTEFAAASSTPKKISDLEA